MIEEFEVGITFVEYEDGEGGKSRPIVVLMVNNEVVLYYKITSQFAGKSKYIQDRYYEIKDWIEAGLKKRSWVDTINPRLVAKDELKVNITGKFTDRDILGLSAFLEERIKEL